MSSYNSPSGTSNSTLLGPQTSCGVADARDVSRHGSALWEAARAFDELLFDSPGDPEANLKLN